MTQSGLAQRLHVSQGKISKIEQGMQGVSDELLNGIASELGYPPSFFEQSGSIYPPATPFHRKKQSLTRKEESQVEAIANIQRQHFLCLQKAADFDYDVPSLDIDEYGSPEKVAMVLRSYWRLPKGPIENLTEVLEDAGIVVVHISNVSDKMDGFTLISPQAKPIVFLNAKMPGDRMRFTLAHELGHIVMHGIHTPDMENEANKFASEFLMPAKEIKPQLRPVSLPKLASLKPYWKVAMAALLKRASDLGVLTPNQTRYMWIKMAPYRMREPVEIDVEIETPTLFRELITFHLKDLEYSVDDLCAALHMDKTDFVSNYCDSGRYGHLVAVK